MENEARRNPFILVKNALPNKEVYIDELREKGVKVSEDFIIDLPPVAPPTQGKSIENFEAVMGHMLEPWERGAQTSGTANSIFFEYHGEVQTMVEMGRENVDKNGNVKPISHQRIEQKIKEEFSNLQNLLPDEVRNAFAQQLLDQSRRNRFDIFLHRQDLLGHNTREIVERALDRQNPPTFEELNTLSGNADRLSFIRGELRQFGMEHIIPNSASDMPLGLSKEQWINLKKIDAQDYEVQDALDTVGVSARNRNVGDKLPVIFLSDLLREADIHSRLALGREDYDLVLSVLKKHHIPYRVFENEVKNGSQKNYLQRYTISGVNQRNRILEALRTDEELVQLRVNPVRSVGREYIGKLPATTELLDRAKFITLGSALQQAGVSIGRVDYQKTFLTPEFPFYVFNNGQTYKIRVEDLEDIKAYLQGFLAKRKRRK